MKNLKDVEVKGKRVLARCDFNVPLGEKGDIKDDFRITQTLPTIEYLARAGAKVVLMSHLGKPDGKFNESLSLRPLARRIEESLAEPVRMIDIEEDTRSLKEGEIVMLENLRFHKGEKDNDPDFARRLSKLADLYVNDAFGVCHRKHASVSEITSYLPGVAGLLLEKEIRVLSRVIRKPERPLVAIIGGAKISSKSMVIKKFLAESDHLLLGGKVANTLLAARGLLRGIEVKEDVQEIIEGFELTSQKVHYPVDAVAAKDNKGTNSRILSLASMEEGETVYDIGPDTINLFADIIREAKTVIWAGPLGMVENPLFEKGTKKIGEEIINNKEALKVAGGGDTNFALLKFGFRDKFDHVSTGGGAMLSFLAGEDLPGLLALEYEKN